MSQDNTTVEIIQAQELAKDILDGKSSSFMIIDVRDVDHKGESIVGSRNVPYFNKDKASNLLKEIVFANQSRQVKIDTVIFHCFYCTIRGPAAAKLFADTINDAAGTSTDSESSLLKVKYLEGGWAKWKQLYAKKPANLIVKVNKD
ncbi:arsenate reductase [Naegleria gruberi]|uniref:Arsenate reductase n=1 Tax=Naegleria gruberi TaxID=5762 RepID=D2V605_NAEGR|nr:arsenate reductase [Naegleria gruberi]EFC47891.1 arsenate reductase [Naegleria gruberi]|eukprot:XP_002680635.1 arsenate reductase [Naegleria gruberi strain NEG-M]